jgi:hypothetical protein
MDRFITAGQTREQMQKEMLRRAAIQQSGYAFIVLDLLSYSHSRISGVEELMAFPTEKKGKYTFQVVTRQIMFEEDINRGGALTYYMLDTEWNRKILASHLNEGYFDIVQVISGREKLLDLYTVIQELAELKQKQISETIKSNAGKTIPKLVPETNKMDISMLSVEDIEKILAKKKMAQGVPPGAHEEIVDLNEPTSEEPVKKDPVHVSRSKVEKKRYNSRRTSTRKTGKFKFDINMSDEEYQKLSPGKKGLVTKARNLAKMNKSDLPVVNVSEKPSPIVVDGKESVSVSSAMPESVFLNKGVGVVQP